MADTHPLNLEEYKIKASILFKHLWSTDVDVARLAAVRFQQLPHLKDSSPQEIIDRKTSLQRKHALAVIALENKAESWFELKRKVEKRAALKSNGAYSSLYPRRCAGFLNEWYASYETARDHRDQIGGFLLPYRNQYFLCREEYIAALGLDPQDPDWELIGWDWAKPANQPAWERLNAKLQSFERTLQI